MQITEILSSASQELVDALARFDIANTVRALRWAAWGSCISCGLLHILQEWNVIWKC